MLMQNSFFIRERSFRVDEVVFDWPFEKLVCAYLEPTSQSEDQWQIFQQQALKLRAEVAVQLSGRKILFAPPIAALQSLASTLHVYDHEWQYCNQLLMSYSCFFVDQLNYFEYFEQQLFYAASRKTLDLNLLSPIKSFMNLIAISAPSEERRNFLKNFSQYQAELPAVVSSIIALTSAQWSAKQISQIGPWIESLSRVNINKLKIKYDPSRRIELPPGFNDQPPQDIPAIVVAQKMCEVIADHYEPFAVQYQLIKEAETQFMEIGVYPTWELYVVSALHLLGVMPNWISSWMIFSEMPVMIAEYTELLRNPSAT